MSKEYYLPKGDAPRNLWLKNFAAKLPGYAVRYNIDNAEVIDIQHGSADFDYRINMVNQWKTYISKWVAYKDELRNGIAAGAVPSAAPTLPNLPGVQTVAAPGIFKRVASVVARIKAHGAYTESDGLDMGIIGVEHSIDYTTLKPEVSVRIGSGGVPEIVWTKLSMDGIAIYKDSGSGFVFYDLDNHPHYQDKHPLPAGAQSAVWKYKIIYREDDVEVGQWSDVLTITVTA
ncbi:hypothetical protein ACTHGU_21950 [Chitinophagaceae bacterium MMS25-I14]